MLSIRLDSPIALTDQIRLGLRRAIALQQLCPGDALPTVRQLAADLGINLNTVARAYRALEADGLVTTVRGRGTRIASSAVRPAPAGDQVRDELDERLSDILADARLGGLERSAVRTLFNNTLASFWPDHEGTNP